jgi:predicted O-methyltransferase YrrM
LFHRFRDQKGNYVPVTACGNALVSLITASLRVAVGYRPVRPSISQSAARRIRTLLPASARIAEFGSGFSTLWFARAFAHVVSVEHDQAWADIVRARLRAGNYSVDYIFAQQQDYANALDVYPDASFDLILVDGLRRDACLSRALGKLKPGGYVYLDNSDTDLDSEDGEMRRAERILHEAVAARGGTLEYFTDFAPINFFAEQGALARL